ncbi:MAG TPA: DDE transposase family protein [Bacteroidales bacterium]|nr:DDE transposase family protein [Bacteroidales bacterium]
MKKSTSLPNRNCLWQTPEEEQTARQDVVKGIVNVFRALLPGLLTDLAKIQDVRNPKKIKHKLTVVLLYGLFAFVFQYSSRREAGREMTRPVFSENLKQLFPELESLPHQDTLYRLLEKIEVEAIETAHIKLLRRLIRKKKFINYLVKKQYLIAIDGTQKFTLNECWGKEYLKRHMKGQEEEAQYYVYLLEAKLVFPNGLVLPLMSEFLDNTIDQVTDKQDCELKAFKRLTARLHQHFPKLPITVLLDGLYSNGPVMALCRKYRWKFMIVLQDESLTDVWKEAKGLHKLNPEQVHTQTWNGRLQKYWWANDIIYEYGPNGRNKQVVHLVVCEETWEEITRQGEIISKTSRHAWISSEPLNRKNVHTRCNLMARQRWSIENDILQEKHQGYQYQHIFSHDWNTMKGYHYLMHLAHLFNELAQSSIELAEQVQELGVRGFVRLLRETISGPWLDLAQIDLFSKDRRQLRLIA